MHERFWEFFNSKAHSAKGPAECILEQLSVVLNGDSDRLVAQTYDGAALMHVEKGVHTIINPLKPNDHYSGRTAQLTSKHCILYIYSTNIGTEYFKHFKMQFVS